MKKYLQALFFTIFTSCGLGSGPDSYNQNSLVEYNTVTGNKKIIRKFEINASSPYVQYFNNSNRFAYLHYTKFHIFDETGKERIIKIDSLFATNFFSISPDDEDFIFYAWINKGTEYNGEGIYRLNINSGQLSLVTQGESEIPYYPIYSKSGNQIVYKAKAKDGFNSFLYLIDKSGNNKTQIATHDYDLLESGIFNFDDSKIYYIQYPDRIMEYDLINKTSNVVVEGFKTSSSYMRNPIFNTYNNYLFFYSNEGNDSFYADKLYSLNLETKQLDTLPISGMPMAFGKEKMLVSGNYNASYDEERSLYIYSLNDKTFKLLDNGLQGDISKDGAKAIYIKSEKHDYED